MTDATRPSAMFRAPTVGASASDDTFDILAPQGAGSSIQGEGTLYDDIDMTAARSTSSKNSGHARVEEV